MTSLRQMRKINGLTRQFVAKQLEISPWYLNQIERGQGSMHIQRAKKLAFLYKENIENIQKSWRYMYEQRTKT